MNQSTTFARALGFALGSVQHSSSSDRFVDDPYVKYLAGLLGLSPKSLSGCVTGVTKATGKVRIVYSPNALDFQLAQYARSYRGTFRGFLQTGLPSRLERLGFTRVKVSTEGLYPEDDSEVYRDPRGRGLVVWDSYTDTLDRRSCFYIIDATVQDKYAPPKLANKGFKNGSKQKKLESVYQWVDLAANDDEYDWLKGQPDYKVFGLPQYLDEGMRYKFVSFDEATGTLSWTTQDYGDRKDLAKFLKQCLGKVGLLGEGGVKVIRVCVRDDNLDDDSSSNKGWTVFKVA